MSLNHFLEALEYPSAASFQFTSRNDLVNLVSWLEDRKIRALEIGERNTIRCNNEDWSDNFERYLQSLECPFSWSEGAADCVAWLVSHAINLEYEDIADTVNEADETHQGGFLPQEKAPMEQDDMDGLDEGISLEIDSLGATIGLDRYKLESDSVFLERVTRRIHLFYSRSARESLDSHTAGKSSSETMLEQFPLGFDIKDKLLTQLALVLKMMHLDDFRDLQSDLNALIVLGQEYTANPRTNNALGKVGR